MFHTVAKYFIRCFSSFSLFSSLLHFTFFLTILFISFLFLIILFISFLFLIILFISIPILILILFTDFLLFRFSSPFITVFLFFYFSHFILKVDDLKNRLGLDAQAQKVDWGTLGVLGKESLAKLKLVLNFIYLLIY